MPKSLSLTAERVQASTTLAIDTRFKEMKANGIDVIGFGAGETDYNTPDHIKEAAISAINNNVTRYTPASGTVELRKAAAKRIFEDCGVSYEPSQIVISSGAKQSLYYALYAITNPGDEMILPAPYWVSYYELIKMTGGTPKVVYTDESTGWKLTADALRAAITPATKALILNNPSNPSGVVYSKEELESLAAVCVEADIYVISDEIYYRLVYGDNKFTSFAALGDKVKALTILVNGVSKSYSMTGWRIGYLAADSRIAKVVGNVQSHAASGPNSIAQAASVEALAGSQESIDVMYKEFAKRRNYFIDRCSKIPGISIIPPDGAFYVMMDVSSCFGRTIRGHKINNVTDFAEAFLEEGLVAVVPCDAFGAPNHVRWSYATSIEDIKAGLDRLEEVLAE